MYFLMLYEVNFTLIKFYSIKLIFNQPSIQEGISSIKIVHQAS